MVSHNSLQKIITLMFALLSLASALPPVILVPPMFGSHLIATATGVDGPWYCARKFEETAIWCSETMLIPPYINCCGEYMKCEWDAVAKRGKSRTNETVWTPDFGGDEGIKYIDTGIIGVHLVSDMKNFEEALFAKGYVLKQDLFGAPYDWRLGPLYTEDWYENMTKLIEEAYERNHERVRLFGYSMGCMMIHQLLAFKVTPEWKQKYIDRVVLAVPSIGGSMDAASIAWERWFDKVPKFLHSESLESFFVSVPTMYAHLPNVHSSGAPIARGPNGEEIQAADALEWLKEHGKITPEWYEMTDAQRAVFQGEMPDPAVDTYIIYNSGIDTLKTMIFEKNWESYTKTFTNGDGTVSSETIDYMYENWGHTGFSLVAHNFNQSSLKYNHVNLLSEKDSIDIATYALTSDEWKNKKRTRLVGMEPAVLEVFRN